MIRTQPRSVLNWSACAELIGQAGMVDFLDEVMMTENEVRDQVQRLIEAANAHRDMMIALRQAEARRAIGTVEANDDVDSMLSESRTLLESMERRLFSLTGRQDVATAYVVVAAAERFLSQYDARCYESESALVERFVETGEAGKDAAQDLHEMLDLALEARSTSLQPLQRLLKRSKLSPVIVDSGKQLTLVH
jgi:hypothetical protein